MLSVMQSPPLSDEDQTLLEELVWSVVLIGGVVAYLVLVVKFPSKGSLGGNAVAGFPLHARATLRD